MHGRLQHGRQPRPPAARPSLGEERRPDGPFAADAERRQKPEDEQMPPLRGEGGKPGEGRVGEDREHECAAASDPVADHSEKRTAKGPPDEKRRLDD